MKTKFSTLRRLVTEREARRIRARGREVSRAVYVFGTVVTRRFKGATYIEHIRT